MTKFWFRAVVLGIVASFFGVFMGLAQAPPSGGPNTSNPGQAAPAKPQFFGGTVIELDANHIRVSRTLVGRPTESRSFSINAATKMNKTAIKLHNHVTVRYKHIDDGDVALEIQLRPVIQRAPKV
jgi:hypothetical protein